MTRLLLTGGSGGIGIALRQKFVENGYSVVAPSSQEFDLSYLQNIKSYFQYIEPRFDIFLGTGSQISIISNQTQTQVDLRPLFYKKYLHTVTHIPSGVGLSTYIKLLGKSAFDEIGCLSVSELEESSLDFDLAVFESAANFKGYQGIRNIRAGNLTRQNYLASLVRSYADQYIALLKLFTIEPHVKTVVLSGGISHRIPALQEYFEQHLPYDVVVLNTFEETLLGVLKLATDIENGRTQE